jgi:hypothetical protein
LPRDRTPLKSSLAPGQILGNSAARDKRDEASWFTEGFDTLDLKEAKALLDELHA